MDAANLEASLELYRSQLFQVEQTLQAAGENEDLHKLKTDLQELIKLTEDSLLSLKKSQLLSHIEDIEGETNQDGGGQHGSMEDEYAAFQASINDNTETSPNTIGDLQSDITGEPVVTNVSGEDVGQSFAKLVGMKCQAPFSHDWGDFRYHNALIMSIQMVDDDSLPKICVMFCNPLHVSMVPCKYFIAGKCHYGDDDCRFSHGHLVNVEELREFKDPDFSKLHVDGKCLALHNDDVWYPATVLNIQNDDNLTISFDASNTTASIPVENVLPLDDSQQSEDDSSDSTESSDSDSDSEIISKHNKYGKEDKCSPSVATQQFGDWEKHTKGIGSKLMLKMGYIMGQGLGVNGEGRTDPVPMQVLPPGKSLDKIMEIKAAMGNSDMFDALKKMEKKQKAEEKKQAETFTKQSKPNIFDFINSKLHGKKGNIGELIHDHDHSGIGRKTKNIVARDLDKKSDRHINIQSLKTQEEIITVEKKLKHLRQSLARNAQKDKKVAKHITEKISAMSEYLQKLQSSERTIEQQKQQRKNHQKLTVF